jgi:hypothetical protein
MIFFARLDKIAGVACIQYRQDIAFHIFGPKLLLRFIPGRASGITESFALFGIKATCEFQKFLLFMVDAVPSVIYDEQAVGPVVFVDELADMVIELVLRLLSDVQFDDFGLVVEAFTEEGVEFSGLVAGQLVAVNSLFSSTHLFTRSQLIQVISPFDQKYSNFGVSVWKIHVLRDSFCEPSCLHLCSLFVVSICHARLALHERLVALREVLIVFRLFVNRLDSNIGMNDFVGVRIYDARSDLGRHCIRDVRRWSRRKSH